MVMTLGGLGVRQFIDLFLIPSMARAYNLKIVDEINRAKVSATTLQESE